MLQKLAVGWVKRRDKDAMVAGQTACNGRETSCDPMAESGILATNVAGAH